MRLLGHPGIGFGRDLVEIVPRSLPELFQQLGDQNNSQKHKKNNKMKIKISKKNHKIAKLKFKGSRHAQLSIYTVFHEESEFQIKNLKSRRPEAKN